MKEVTNAISIELINRVQRSFDADPSTDKGLVGTVIKHNRQIDVNDPAITQVIDDLYTGVPAIAAVSVGMRARMFEKNTYEIFRTLIVEAGPQHDQYLFKGYTFESLPTAKAVLDIIAGSGNAHCAVKNLRYMVDLLKEVDSAE